MGRSALIAALVVVALVLWMASGQFGDSPPAEKAANTTEADKPVARMKVQTRALSSERVTREIAIQGQLEPIKVVSLRAETTGNIAEIMYSKGQRIDKGNDLARISLDNRSADLAVARANLVQANNEYEGARKLQKQGLQSKFTLETADAKREAARAQVQSAQLAIENTRLSSPMNALIEDIHVKDGDFLERGALVATLVDNSQLLVTGDVAQQHIADVKTGQLATAELVTGQTLEGRVRYISSMANSTTRSFKVEILIENPPAGTLTGISANISIPVESMMAHLVSPAVLALDDAGNLGVKALGPQNTVVFHEIKVVKTESDGAWVTGLPDEVTLITLGQGFVNPGEQVEPVSAPVDNTSAGRTNDNNGVSRDSTI